MRHSQVCLSAKVLITWSKVTCHVTLVKLPRNEIA